MQSGNDNNQPILNLPPAVRGLCLVIVAVHLLQAFLPQLMSDDFIVALAFIPARYTGDLPLGIAGLTSTVTHMFVHGGWMHLIVNIAGLMAFGAGLEKIMGARRLLIFYFACGFCGAAAHFLLNMHETAPMIGASGAISGLFGGVMMMMYSAGMLGSGYRRLLPLIIVWILMSMAFGFFGLPGVDSPIAWATHVGGFLGGLLLYRPVMRLRPRAPRQVL